jgi:hypothetical protein
MEVRDQIARSLPPTPLDDDENIVHRAVSTQTVCGGGDGDLRTAVVPARMMMIAENTAAVTSCLAT